MTEEKAEPGNCHFCGKGESEEGYCWGCKKHICEDCSINWDMPWGGHDVEVHQEEPEEEVEE